MAAIAVHFATLGQPWNAGAVVLALLGSLLVSYTRARAEGLGATCTVGFGTRLERGNYPWASGWSPAWSDRPSTC